MNRRGKKVKAWDSARAKLKVKFQAAGIMTCELRYAGCAFDNYLGFAHAHKRRKVTDLSIAILCCNFCHDEIEIKPHEEMERIVMAVIAAREVQPR